MLSRTISLAYSAAGAAINSSFALTGGGENNIDETIPAAASNAAIGSFALDVSQCVALYIVASAAMVLETNSGSSPVNIFTLAAGVPFVWFTGMPALRDTAGTAVTTDITALFVTSTDGGLLQIRALHDPTV